MTEAALDNALKERIQVAYRTWLGERAFNARRGQREMIASIARVLTRAEGQRRIAAIEAGTGTGKTAAYCIAAIPIAQALGKRLVIATATVALQEQIVLRDLPDLAARSGLEFSFALAKGRQRYVCLKRLDDRLRDESQDVLPMFEPVSGDARVLYQNLLGAFARGEWDGDVDGWADGIDDAHWRNVTTDHRGCASNRCGFFRQCPFFKSRGRLDKADVVVANLDLVLADLALGGGAVLSDPAETIYVLDEAHHLPDKTQQHFTFRLRLRGTLQWLDQVNASVGTLAQRVGRPGELLVLVQQMTTLTARLARTVVGFSRRWAASSFVVRDARSRFGVRSGESRSLAASCRTAATAWTRSPDSSMPRAVAVRKSWTATAAGKRATRRRTGCRRRRAGQPRLGDVRAARRLRGGYRPGVGRAGAARALDHAACVRRR